MAALGARTRDAGLAVVSYGSYLGMAPSGPDDAEVDAVLETAAALGAPMVRIWAELGVTPTSAPTERLRVAEHTSALARAVVDRGMAPALEFHPGTLTETARSTNQLIEAVGQPELRTHWQPDPSLDAANALDELAWVAPHLAHLHVFSWGPTGIDDRRPLTDGESLWVPAIELAERDGPLLTRYALCEYVRDDDPEQFVADAHVLRSWLDSIDRGRQ
jgi:hypothetical protein